MSLSLAASASAQTPLAVEGYADASFVEATAPGRRPVVVVLHGNFDRPEWSCAAWANAVRGRAFLLCPRGLPRTDAPGLDRWHHRLPRPLAREVAAARAALAARFAGRVDDGPDVWIGFSQGAHRIARLVGANGSSYPLVQLVEGGNSLFASGARGYRGRIAIVCAQPFCVRGAARVVSELGASARTEHVETCHACLDELMPAIVRTFDWLIENDARF